MKSLARNWRVAVLTYNVNARKALAGPIYKLFDEEEFGTADFIAIGLQARLSIRVIETLLHCSEVPHSELLGNTFLDTSWVTIISSWMYANQKALLYRTSSATNLLFIFARLEAFAAVERIDMRLSRTTFYGLTGHKGSLSVRLKIKGGDGLVFITSHLVPHLEGYEKRCLQYVHGKICTFEDELPPSTSYSTVWLGDMNWRTESLGALEMNERLTRLEKDEQINLLADEVDQLRKAKRSQEAFTCFTEEPIYFNPTYRLLVGTGDYDLFRVPSWCDRILYKGEYLQCETYRSNRNIHLSDHFPVISFFSHTPSAQAFKWNVVFEELPQWSSVVPVFCRFSFANDFWKTDAAYRDWVAIYPEEITDPYSPISWLYVLACYTPNENDKSLYVGEFACLSPGRYRFGYFSTKTSCLQGISAAFVVGD